MKRKVIKILYYVLNCTWGCIMVIIGAIAALYLKCRRYNSTVYGGCRHFVVGKDWGGVSLGLIIITDDTTSVSAMNHEFGHSIQNAIYGILFPFIVAIPSAIRSIYRRQASKKGATLPPYDSVWFEGQATKWGTKGINIF